MAGTKLLLFATLTVMRSSFVWECRAEGEGGDGGSFWEAAGEGAVEAVQSGGAR